jgi:hypothetical protein
LCTKFLTLKDNILEITLMNRSPGDNGGFITADAFNLGPDVHVSRFDQLSGPMNFELVTGSIKTSPFSDRQFVITISPNASQPWLGGGSPHGGIPPGQRATFQLTLDGEGVESLTVRNILKSQLIRFKGFANGSSDKDWIAAGLHGRCDEDLPGLCVKQLALSGNTLLLKLVNTSPVGNGGFITADGFDLGPDVQVTAFTQLTGPPNFSLTEGPVDTAPFGTREFVISLSNQWQEGGTASDGIGVQESATFQLTLSGKGVKSLQADKILESQVIRFREFTNGDNDKDRVVLQ